MNLLVLVVDCVFIFLFVIELIVGSFHHRLAITNIILIFLI